MPGNDSIPLFSDAIFFPEKENVNTAADPDTIDDLSLTPCRPTAM